MSATLSRSDVLRPLAWLVGILALMFVVSLYENANNYILLIISACITASVLLYVGAYIYCLIYDRDALRSEHYSLHKMAIEHGMFGDSRIGLIKPNATPSASTVLSAPTDMDGTP